jgi:hypothetical protein
MSDRSGASRVILSGLAVGAIFGAPAAAAASEPSAAGTTSIAAASSSCPPSGDEFQTAAAAIREQFRASFIPGAVTASVMDATAVICERS